MSNGSEASGLMGGMELAAAAAPLVMGYMSSRKQKEIEDAARLKAELLEKQIDAKLAARQDPTNPYANLGVATKAAEMKLEQADQDLANILDTVRSTGGGAATATVLARQAAAAKQGIAASIETQEVANQQKFAEGEKLRLQEVAEREMLDLDIAAGRADREYQREMDAMTAGQASMQAGVKGSSTILGNIMENPENVQALFGGG